MERNCSEDDSCRWLPLKTEAGTGGTWSINNRDECWRLKQLQDFTCPRILVEDKVQLRGHICLFFPKFHCELNAVERNWCHAKKHTRAYAMAVLFAYDR